MSRQPADLEIELQRLAEDTFSLDFRFNQAGSEGEIRLLADGRATATFERPALQALLDDPKEYGKRLGECLFADPQALAAFEKAAASAQSQDSALRVRLALGVTAADLHDLRWEALVVPGATAPLCTNERLMFSRYLSSADFRPVHLRPHGELRAVVAIANPKGLANNVLLAPIDVEAEKARANASLAGVRITYLGGDGSATLSNIAASLRDDPDVLYLVCHGQLVDGAPWLWLEDHPNRPVEAQALVTVLTELQRLPRLVVLASCQSAGTGTETKAGGQERALSGLGPKLAVAGIPAVVAMQGNVNISTVDTFMPVFFTELQRDGLVDRAMAAARAAVRDRDDWSVPALFTRLKSGRLWAPRGFGDDAASLRVWPAIIANIRDGECTPVVGSGLCEHLFGPQQDMAARWAEQNAFPLAPHERMRLPDVALYLAVNQDSRFARRQLDALHVESLLAHHGAIVPEEQRTASLPELMRSVGAVLRERDENEPYRVLAELPVPVYISAESHDLLEDALRSAGKDPVTEVCRWNDKLQARKTVDDEAHEPDERRPLVFHLFGHHAVKHSTLLTVDDYFDFLIGMTRRWELIPTVVSEKLVDSSLLFMGLNVQDWAFRVLHRTIRNIPGLAGRSDYAHVAGQVDAEALDPDAARKYLEQYFKGADFSIYWGTPSDFAAELHRRLQAGGK